MQISVLVNGSGFGPLTKTFLISQCIRKIRSKNGLVLGYPYCTFNLNLTKLLFGSNILPNVFAFSVFNISIIVKIKLGNKNLPKFEGKVFNSWKNELKTWQLMTDLKKEKNKYYRKNITSQ